MKYIFAIVLILVILPVYADGVVIGVLEQPQGDTLQKVSARILFEKQNDKWVARKDPNSLKKLDLGQMTWTVAFDSRKIGEVKLFDPDPEKKFINEWYYSRDKIFQIPSNQKIPLVENKSKLFAGWSYTPQYRPLVLVSEPNFADPEQWKPFTPDESYKIKLYVPLRIAIGRFNQFKSYGVNLDQIKPYTFTPEDIMFYKCYSSASGKKLVAIGLNFKKFPGEGMNPAEWKDTWFLLDGENIDFLGRELTLIDSGDYDNDGKSELLFWHSGYDEDGYVLMYNSVSEEVEYLWRYH